MPIVYAELRKTASTYLRRDRDVDREVAAGANKTIELLALDEALEQLSRVSPRQARSGTSGA